MKIIEGLKKQKDLLRKAQDLRDKIGQYSAHLDFETPAYTNQKEQITKWIQSHRDVLGEIGSLRFRVQKTNLETDVTIRLGEKDITKKIAEWIHRRRDLANLEAGALRKLTDKNLKEGQTMSSNGEPVTVKLVRCYDQVFRDEGLIELDSEPSVIDGKLEIVNAVTDLVE